MRLHCSAILALALLIPSPKAHLSRTDSDTKVGSYHDPSAKAGPPFAQSPSTQKAEQKSSKNENPAYEDTAIKLGEFHLSILITIAAGIQAFAALAQVFIYRKQSRLMAESLTATQKAAAAALTNAQIMQHSERAWIIEKIDFPEGELPFQRTDIPSSLMTTFVAFEFTNFGKTVGMITDFRLRFHTIPRLEDLPQDPYYGNLPRLQELGESGFIAAPGLPSKIGVRLEENLSLSQTQASAIFNGDLFLCAYGKIEYVSLGEKHVNQFCYIWYAPRGIITANDPSRFRKGGPPAYNKAT